MILGKLHYVPYYSITQKGEPVTIDWDIEDKLSDKLKGFALFSRRVRYDKDQPDATDLDRWKDDPLEAYSCTVFVCTCQIDFFKVTHSLIASN